MAGEGSLFFPPSIYSSTFISSDSDNRIKRIRRKGSPFIHPWVLLWCIPAILSYSSPFFFGLLLGGGVYILNPPRNGRKNDGRKEQAAPFPGSIWERESTYCIDMPKSKSLYSLLYIRNLWFCADDMRIKWYRRRGCTHPTKSLLDHQVKGRPFSLSASEFLISIFLKNIKNIDCESHREKRSSQLYSLERIDCIK